MYGKCQYKTLKFCFFHSADSDSTSIHQTCTLVHHYRTWPRYSWDTLTYQT